MQSRRISQNSCHTPRFSKNYYSHNVTQNIMRPPFPFQVIIPASWMFALIMNIPEFLSLDFDKTLGSCTLAWTEGWMGKAYSMLWFLAFGVLPIPLMVSLYSTVVYNLWFKRNEQNELSYQQKVRAKVLNTFRGAHYFALLFVVFEREFFLGKLQCSSDSSCSFILLEQWYVQYLLWEASKRYGHRIYLRIRKF